MLFSSTVFIFVFLPTVLLGYFLIFRKTNIRNYWLLAASLVFYAWGEPVYVFLMLASVLGNYLLGFAIHYAQRKCARDIWLIITVILNLGALFYFKYLNFVVENLNLLFGLNITIQKLSLPIGISFFTFQAMSYVIDVYRKTAEVQRNPFYLALYISFFPQLIAGPIVRYNTIARQIHQRTVTLDKFQSGVIRFIQGFSKKIILSNMMALTSERVFSLAASGELSVGLAWLGALAYTFQIFFDFSGYSDMAIGLGRMFGFEFEENFRYPYLSKSVSEFWNRWHISLGQWFRDYVYFPLGGSRVSKRKLLRNLFVVWMLTGIWHGAAWQFIVWGLAYGILISLEKLTGIPKRLKHPAAIIGYGIFTFLTVVLGWVLFGAYSFPAALYQLGAMFGQGATGIWDPLCTFTLREYGSYFLLAAVFSTPLPGKLSCYIKKGTLYSIGQAFVYMMLLLISISYLFMGSHNPFIYFHF